jgi:hypothetical protein
MAAKLDELSAANLALSAENAELRAKLKLNSKNSSKRPGPTRQRHRGWRSTLMVGAIGPCSPRPRARQLHS